MMSLLSFYQNEESRLKTMNGKVFWRKRSWLGGLWKNHEKPVTIVGVSAETRIPGYGSRDLPLDESARLQAVSVVLLTLHYKEHFTNRVWYTVMFYKQLVYQNIFADPKRIIAEYI
jgi:hypothetical protein